jgi:hypothetical protein
MNHLFLEVRGREKLNELRREGLMSQAFCRNKPEKPNIFVGLWGGFSTLLRFLFRIPHTKKKTVVESRSQI